MGKKPKKMLEPVYVKIDKFTRDRAKILSKKLKLQMHEILDTGLDKLEERAYFEQKYLISQDTRIDLYRYAALHDQTVGEVLEKAIQNFLEQNDEK